MFLLIFRPCCFAVCGHHLSPRITIVFSLLSSVPNVSMSHSSIFIISWHIPYLLVHFTWSHYVSLLYYFCHRGTSVHLPPPLDYRYISLFFPPAPGPLHKIEVSAFSRSPSCKIRFHSRCKSVRIASILPTINTWALPVPNYFAMRASHEHFFEISTPRYVYWSAIGE